MPPAWHLQLHLQSPLRWAYNVVWLCLDFLVLNPSSCQLSLVCPSSLTHILFPPSNSNCTPGCASILQPDFLAMIDDYYVQPDILFPPSISNCTPRWAWTLWLDFPVMIDAIIKAAVSPSVLVQKHVFGLVLTRTSSWIYYLNLKICWAKYLQIHHQYWSSSELHNITWFTSQWTDI